MAEYLTDARRSRTTPCHPLAKPRDFAIHDPLIDNVKLLLQGSGIEDTSRSRRSLSNIGSPTVDSTRWLYEGHSTYLLAGSDGIGVASGLSDFDINGASPGQLDVTAFVYLTGTTVGVYYTIFEIAYTVGGVGKKCVVRFGDSGFGNRLQCAVDESATATVWSASTSYTKSAMVNAWHKIRFRLNNVAGSLYVDDDRVQLQNSIAAGAFLDAFTPTQTIGGVTAVTVGCESTGAKGFVGSIQEIRFTCQNWRAFVLPTEPFPTA